MRATSPATCACHVERTNQRQQRQRGWHEVSTASNGECRGPGAKHGEAHADCTMQGSLIVRSRNFFCTFPQFLTLAWLA